MSFIVCAATPGVAHAIWPFTSEEAPVGTAQWWKKHKSEAVFVPGQGYQVQGVDGYFDGDGRPIHGPVARERIVEANEGKDDNGLIPALDPRVQYDKVKTAVGLGPNEQIARQDYAEGDRLFREKSYRAAAEKFKAAVDRGPHSAIQQDAMFMLAESYFFDDRYIKARDAYDALVKEHTNTRYLDQVIDREWKIARYWELYDQRHPHYELTPNGWDKTRPWFDTLGHAIKTYDSIRLNDPTGPRADDAIMATANIYFEHGRYDDADYHYTLLRREYPRSEFQFQAHLLGLQAKLRKYQGEDYDGTPLEEAKKLVKDLNSQFADRLSTGDKQRVTTTEAWLNREIATRDYRMAGYFDKKKDYGAARFYYAEVIKKYPDTELAKESRDRVAELKGEPEIPAKPLGFIVDHLPESRERTRVARIPELQKSAADHTRLAEAPDNGDTTVGNTPPTTTTK
ncbi:MAG TPA: outer membrane protein assembly factor BamD [Lacipirellulaceae bacterium]|nr:outer membrane protein assembly factor BamD [Lacipirellulaceae bacterium]